MADQSKLRVRSPGPALLNALKRVDTRVRELPFSLAPKSDVFQDACYDASIHTSGKKTKFPIGNF